MLNKKPMINVVDKVVLISGAARGIGEVTAKMLAADGAMVMVSDILKTAGQQVVSDIIKDGGKACFTELDVTVEADWEAAVAKTIETFGGLDVLVNNAGTLSFSVCENTDYDFFNRIMAINCGSAFLGTKHGILAMKPGGSAGNGGSIINLSSTSGIVGGANQTAYCASKGAVRMLTKAAALECASLQYDIRVNGVFPGMADTLMPRGAGESMVEAGVAPNRDVLWSAFLKSQPLGLLQPEDIAGAIYYLASDASEMVTGIDFCVDGGFCAM